MKSEIEGLKGAGEKITGEILFLGEGEIGLTDLNSKAVGKIVAGKEFGKAVLEKALTLEAAGIVAVQMADELFQKISQGKNWEIGEHYWLTLPLLIVKEEDLAFLKENHGKKVVLDPAGKKLSLCP